MSIRVFHATIQGMDPQIQIVRTRIAPSPTGFPHIGTIYQVLFDWAFAKSQRGQFILRIEDTDRARFVEGAEEVIYDSLNWFGLIPDESPILGGAYGPYRQSERLVIYQRYAQELIKKDYAYYCFCTRERLEKMRQEQIAKKLPPMYDELCLTLATEEIERNLQTKVPFVIRMKVPQDQKILIDDLIAGRVEFDSNVIDHQVLIKSDGFPTYHLGVVVDDHEMKISHVFRGKEWLSSTPKHKLLYDYFGWQMPVYGHLPLILNSDGKGKLSKRHGHASVAYYKQEGFLPEAVLNYLSNIVWHHPQGKEIYSLAEFIKYLDMTKITSQGARFDLTKLQWMNGEYIRNKPDSQLSTQIYDFFAGKYTEDLIEKIIPLAKERIKTLKDFAHYIKPFVNYVAIELEEKYKNLLPEFNQWLSTETNWTTQNLEKKAKEIVINKQLPMRDAFMALRLATTGEKVGLPLFQTWEILGKNTIMERLHKSL